MITQFIINRFCFQLMSAMKNANEILDFHGRCESYI